MALDFSAFGDIGKPKEEEEKEKRESKINFGAFDSVLKSRRDRGEAPKQIVERQKISTERKNIFGGIFDRFFGKKQEPITAGLTTPSVVAPEQAFAPIGPESGTPVRGFKEELDPLEGPAEVRIPFFGRAPEFLQPRTPSAIGDFVGFLSELPEKNVNDIRDYVTLVKQGRLDEPTPKEEFENVPSHVREFQKRIDEGVNPVGASLLFFGETILDWSIVGGEAKNLIKKALDVPVIPGKQYVFTRADLAEIQKGEEFANKWYKNNQEKLAAYMKNKPKNIGRLLKEDSGFVIKDGKSKSINQLIEENPLSKFKAKKPPVKTAPVVERGVAVVEDAKVARQVVELKTPQVLAKEIKPLSSELAKKEATSFLSNPTNQTYTRINGGELNILRDEVGVIPAKLIDDTHLSTKLRLEGSDAVEVSRKVFLEASQNARIAIETVNKVLKLQDKTTLIADKVAKIKAEAPVVKVPRGQLPVSPGFGKGTPKPSRLATRLKNNLDTLTDAQKSKLPEFTSINRESQLRKAANFVKDNQTEALAVLKGERPAPSGILNASIGRALFEQASIGDDIALALELTSLRATRAGQELSMLVGIDEMNPAVILSDTKKSRIKALTQADKRIMDSVKRTGKKTLNKELVKAAPGKDVWKDFIKEITC